MQGKFSYRLHASQDPFAFYTIRHSNQSYSAVTATSPRQKHRGENRHHASRDAFNTSASHRWMLPLSLCHLETWELGICSRLLSECAFWAPAPRDIAARGRVQESRSSRESQSVCPKAQRSSETVPVK